MKRPRSSSCGVGSITCTPGMEVIVKRMLFSASYRPFNPTFKCRILQWRFFTRAYWASKRTSVAIGQTGEVICFELVGKKRATSVRMAVGLMALEGNSKMQCGSEGIDEAPAVRQLRTASTLTSASIRTSQRSGTERETSQSSLDAPAGDQCSSNASTRTRQPCSRSLRLIATVFHVTAF